jgi:hypothetical protein
MNRNNIALIFVIFVLALMCLKCCMGMGKSGYKLSPSSVEVEPVVNRDAMNKLPYTMDCVPGPGKDAAYYTKDLTPGGYCGDQALVRESMSYKILGGIGGSLLNK